MLSLHFYIMWIMKFRLMITSVIAECAILMGAVDKIAEVGWFQLNITSFLQFRSSISSSWCAMHSLMLSASCTPFWSRQIGGHDSDIIIGTFFSIIIKFVLNEFFLFYVFDAFFVLFVTYNLGPYLCWAHSYASSSCSIRIGNTPCLRSVLLRSSTNMSSGRGNFRN